MAMLEYEHIWILTGLVISQNINLMTAKTNGHSRSIFIYQTGTAALNMMVNSILLR